MTIENKTTDFGNLQLLKKIIIEGKIIALTGLHIGGSSGGIDIGGINSPVIRDNKNIPYIPGSSIKGKLRALLEKFEGKVKIVSKDSIDKGVLKTSFTGELCNDEKEDLVQLFGFAANNPIEYRYAAPTRLIVRDAKMNEESIKILSRSEFTDTYLTEVKTETSIDRLTSKANPRTYERVPAGAEFDLNLIVDIYNCDQIEETKDKKENINRDEKFLKQLARAMSLLESDYLGGQGTRGYGRIKFKIDSVKVKTAANYQNDQPAVEDIKLKAFFGEFISEEK